MRGRRFCAAMSRPPPATSAAYDAGSAAIAGEPTETEMDSRSGSQASAANTGTTLINGIAKPGHRRRKAWAATQTAAT